MAGSGAALGFDAAEFRDAIHLAMRMGSPGKVLDKATFRWDKVRTYVPGSPSGDPYVWSAVAATDLSQPDVVLDEVAVEYSAGRTIEGTNVGQFVPLRAELTLLDVDHARVLDDDGLLANWVLLHEVVWGVAAETVGALFDVDVHTLYLERQQ